MSDFNDFLDDAKNQYHSGENPKPGTYVCMQCVEDNEAFIVPEMGRTLPECSKCGHTEWYKV